MKGPIILVIEDNPITSKVLRLASQSENYQILEAQSGKKGLELLKQHKPQVVLQDLILSDVDGYELIRQLRALPEGKEIPILGLSGFFSDTDTTKIKEIGFNEFLIKPLEMSSLINLIKSYVSPSKDAPIMDGKIGLAQRCGLQAAQLNLLGGIADALTDNTMSIEETLQNVLLNCLDSAGISKGALYLLDTNAKLRLKHFIGYKQEDKTLLESFFGQSELFNKAFRDQTPIQFPSKEGAKEIENKFLKQAGLRTALIIPLISQKNCLGIMVLGSLVDNISGTEPLVFGRALGSQIGQAIGLSDSFEQLHNSEKHYKTIMQQASCGILILDLEGNILEINTVGAAIFGRNNDQLIGKNLKEFVVSEEHDKLYQEFKHVKENKILTEGHIQRLDGSRRELDVSATFMDVGGKKLVVSIINDITEKNKLKIQSLLNDKLTTVGTLAAGVVHEINNPIAWIMANISSLTSTMKTIKLSAKDASQQEAIDKFNEILEETAQGAERIRDIVSNLKSFAREGDKKDSEIHLNDILNAAINMSFPQYKYKATLEKNFSPDIPVFLANSGKLHQVFLNLIVNAGQAIPEGKIAKNKISIRTILEGQFVKVDITDTGAGIPSDILPQIFNPFFTTKSAGGGTGLGLYICQDIIQNLGGKITVKSVPGKGTTFSVYLPISKNVSQEKQPMKADSMVYTKNKKILIIDDEPSLLKSMARLLEDYHQITTANGGQAALDLIVKDNGKFDVIISDLSMPDVAGPDIYKYISEKYPELKEKIIFITGGAFTPKLQEFLDSIPNLCLEKPFMRDDLLKAIDKCTK